MQKPMLNQSRLILCREKLNITKQEAAIRMQMSQPAYLRYESGERQPSIHVIQAMANVLDTSVAYLTGESDSPFPTNYFIQKNLNPELFSLIEAYKNTDSAAQSRFLDYMKKLSKEE